MTIGLESWFHNFSQFIYRANTPEVLADIPRPYVEYSVWGLFKGAEITSVLGGLVAHPLYRWYLTRQLTPEKTTPNSHKIIRSACRRLQGRAYSVITSGFSAVLLMFELQGRFLLCGLVAGPVAAALHSWSIGNEAVVRDMCYAIRCDTNALSMDRFVLLFGFVGWYWKRFQGAVDGINIAVVYALINAKVIAPRTSPLLKDRVQPHERYSSVEEAANNRSRLRRFLAEEDKRRAIEDAK